MKRLDLPPGTLGIALPIAAVLTAIVSGVWLGIEVMLLVVAGAALLGVIALLWASVQSLTGESPLTLEEALGMGAPSAEEEQKRAVLRGLKDLEFERSVGKISDEDYHELSERYRQEAKRLMRALDESAEPARARVDKLVAERMTQARGKKPKPEAEADADAPREDEASAADDDTAEAESAPGGEAAGEARASAPPASEPSLDGGSAARRAREAGEEST